MHPFRLLSFACLILVTASFTRAQGVNVAEAEALKCEEKIASVRRDVLGKYEDLLSEMQLTMQKSADLEGALAVRTERQRLTKERALTEENLVNQPKTLRAMQAQMLARMQELIAQLVQETVPRLVEYKKTLTMSGKLDEAVNVRTAIEKLQNSHLPIVRPAAGSVIASETLVLAYEGDRARADKTYKGQKVTVRGVIGGYRQDPADTRLFNIYLAAGSSSWVQCAFSATQYRFREETGAFGAQTLVITPRDGEGMVRVQKGQSIDIRGVCEGFDQGVRLGKCELEK